jgi:hypothetical protein
MGAAMLGTGRKGCTELEEWQSMLVVHACAHFATSQPGPHLATICSSRIAKAMDTCSTLGRARESYTKLYGVDSLKGERGKSVLFLYKVIT